MKCRAAVQFMTVTLYFWKERETQASLCDHWSFLLLSMQWVGPERGGESPERLVQSAAWKWQTQECQDPKAGEEQWVTVLNIQRMTFILAQTYGIWSHLPSFKPSLRIWSRGVSSLQGSSGLDVLPAGHKLWPTAGPVRDQEPLFGQERTLLRRVLQVMRHSSRQRHNQLWVVHRLPEVHRYVTNVFTAGQTRNNHKSHEVLAVFLFPAFSVTAVTQFSHISDFKGLASPSLCWIAFCVCCFALLV